MGKKFNFGSTPAASEIDEEMTSVNQRQEEKANNQPLGKKRSSRTKTEDWTLVQCRLPNDLNRRMSIYNLNNELSKNDFIVHAVRSLLDTLGA